MEYYNGQILANACWSGGQDGRVRWDTVKKPLAEFKDDAWDQRFHIWRMDWDEESIKLYVDDLLLNTIDLSRNHQRFKSRAEKPIPPTALFVAEPGHWRHAGW